MKNKRKMIILYILFTLSLILWILSFVQDYGLPIGATTLLLITTIFFLKIEKEEQNA